MARFSQPRGVRALPSLDFLYRYGAAGHASLPNNPPFDSQAILLNTDQTRWVFVYSINIISNFAELGLYFAQQNLTPGATLQGSCYPFVCDAPAPAVQLFGAYVAALDPATVTYPFVNVFNVSSQGTGYFPIAVIKPGYSLVVQCQNDQLTDFVFLQIGP